MANRLGAKIVYFDTFGTDTTLAEDGRDFIVKKIRWKSVADGDILRLENFNNEVIFEDIQTSSGDFREVDFGDDGFNFGGKGVRIDVSECTGMAATDGTDAVWIHLA